MKLHNILLGAGIAVCCISAAGEVDDVIRQTATGLELHASPYPYSRTIERIYIAYDSKGEPKTGIAHRTIESYKPITGVVIVDKTDKGYVLREALFPDIGKIRNPRDRERVQSILERFRNVPFDPYAEKSAVDTVSGATRYTIKESGYLSYMARRVALEMEKRPGWKKYP